MADQIINVGKTQSAALIHKWKRRPGQLKMSRMASEAYKKDMKAGLLLHRITDAERNEIDLAESMGPAALMDEARAKFKAAKEKASHFVTADGKKIGGVPQAKGDIFTFLNKLLKHEMKRADDHMSKEMLKQQGEQIKDESVKAEWQQVIAKSNRPAEDLDDLTTFRKKKEAKLADLRPATAPVRRQGDKAAEFQAWPGNEWNGMPRGLSAHRSHSTKVKEALGRKKAAALVPGTPGFDEFEFKPVGRKWAAILKVQFKMNEKKIIVGRSDSCDIKLDKYSCTRDDLKAISREQCSIFIDELGIMTIKDHSSNGTLVNDLLICSSDNKCPDSCPLTIGDTVTFGAHASSCKYVLSVNKQPRKLSQIDVSQLRGREDETDCATDAVKQARILAGDAKVAAREADRAWALWANLESLVKDMSSVKCLVNFATRGSPHQCAHAAAALHSLSKDPVGLNHLINAGGISALSTLAAVNDEFIDGLETCKEEALLGLRSVIMLSAEGRHRVSKDGALRVLIKIAGNRDDPMRYIAEEAVREFEEIEDREKADRAEQAAAKNSRRVSPSPSRPLTANSRVTWSSDGLSDAGTDVYTMASSRPNSTSACPKASVEGARLDYERTSAFRPQSAIVKHSLHSRPGHVELLSDKIESRDLGANSSEGQVRLSQRPASAATILTQQQYFGEAAKRLVMFKKEYISTHEEPVHERHESGRRPGSVDSSGHKTKVYHAFERTNNFNFCDGGSSDHGSARQRYLKQISDYDSQFALSAERRGHINRTQKKDPYMPAVPRGPVTGTSCASFVACNELLEHGQRNKIDGIYREYLKVGGLPRDIDDILSRHIQGISECNASEISSIPSSDRTAEEQDELEMDQAHQKAEVIVTNMSDGPCHDHPHLHVLQRPGSAVQKDRSRLYSPLPLSRTRPVSAGGLLGDQVPSQLLSSIAKTEDHPIDFQSSIVMDEVGEQKDIDRESLSHDQGVTFQRTSGSNTGDQRPRSADPFSAFSYARMTSANSNVGIGPKSKLRPHTAGGCETGERGFTSSDLDSHRSLNCDSSKESLEIERFTPQQPFQVESQANEQNFFPYQRNFSRPTTPGGLMPIIESIEGGLTESMLVDGSLASSEGADECQSAVLMLDRSSSTYAGDKQGQIDWIKQALAPIWGLIFDEFFVLSQIVGRFFNEQQVLNLVQGIHRKAINEAKSTQEAEALETFKSSDLEQFLRANVELASKPGGGLDYLTLTEMLSPDLLSRRTLQIFNVLQDKTAEGVWVAQLQQALALGNMRQEDIARISGMSRCEYSAKAAKLSTRKRIKFSALYGAIRDVVGGGETVDVRSQQRRLQHRHELERALQAAADATCIECHFPDTFSGDDLVPQRDRDEDFEVDLPRDHVKGRDGFEEDCRAEFSTSGKYDEYEEDDVYFDVEGDEEHFGHTNFDLPMSRSLLQDSFKNTSSGDQGDSPEEENSVFTRHLSRDRFCQRSGSRARPDSGTSSRLESPSSVRPSNTRSNCFTSCTMNEADRTGSEAQDFDGTLTRDGEKGSLHDMAVNQSRARAQSAPMGAQSARNRLLSRGLPSTAAHASSAAAAAATAIASAATTVSNSTNTTAPHSGVTSGTHTPDKLLHVNGDDAEEELRYKQALVRALEKSYLDEVSKIHREIQQLAARREGYKQRPATASEIFPHRSNTTMTALAGCLSPVPHLPSSPSSLRRRRPLSQSLSETIPLPATASKMDRNSVEEERGAKIESTSSHSQSRLKGLDGLKESSIAPHSIVSPERYLTAGIGGDEGAWRGNSRRNGPEKQGQTLTAHGMTTVSRTETEARGGSERAVDVLEHHRGFYF